MSTSTVSTPIVSSSSERFTGRVKWFNNKAGYGFITITDGPESGSDVFVHHSSIKVDSEQYKYLVQGEYVDFSLYDTKTQRHKFQAGEVCGINGGKLMCETRHEYRNVRSQYCVTKTESDTSNCVKMPRSVSVPKEQKRQTLSRARSLDTQDEGSEWTLCVKTRKATEPVQSTRQPQLGPSHHTNRRPQGADRH